MVSLKEYNHNNFVLKELVNVTNITDLIYDTQRAKYRVVDVFS